MKLPTDKKERVKILVMILLGVTVVLYVTIQFGLGPVIKSISEKRARIRETSEELAQAKKEINRMTADLARNKETLIKLKEISSKYVIMPVLHNYILSATDIVEAQAKKVNVKLDSVREQGITEFTAAPGQQSSTRFLKCYTIRVSLSCGYNDLIKLIQQIENVNPYFCITSLSITGQPDKDVARHQMSFDLQWPTWVDQEMPLKLDAKLSELQREFVMERNVESNEKK
jgi:hypothetical protein